MKKVLRITANVLAWLIVIFALLVTILVFSSTNNNGVPQLFGFIPLTVESQSMKPTFDQGDLIIDQQINDPAELKVDDVISFWTIIDGTKVKNTHRIVRIETKDGITSFITRGDNNPIDDVIPTYPADLIGKWTGARLSGAGNIMAFLRTKLGFFLCILIPMALFFLFELYKFIVTVVKVKKANAEPQLDEEEIKRRAIEEYLAAQKAKEAEGKADEKSGDKKDESKADEKSGNKKDDSKADEKSGEKKDDSKADEKSGDKKEDSKADEKSGDKKDESKADEKPGDKKDESMADEKSGDKKDDSKADEKSGDKKDDSKADEKSGDKKEDSKADEKSGDKKEDSKADEKSGDKKDDSKADEKSGDKKDDSKADTGNDTDIDKK